MGRSGVFAAGLKYAALALGGAAIGAIAATLPMHVVTNVASDAAVAAQSLKSAVERNTASENTYEIIAFEAPGCVYCEHLRRDIARSYGRSEHAKKAPVRFLDVNASEVSGLKLSQAITQIPTAVVMRDGEEIGRIGGYVGRQNFMQMLDSLLTH